MTQSLRAESQCLNNSITNQGHGFNSQPGFSIFFLNLSYFIVFKMIGRRIIVKNKQPKAYVVHKSTVMVASTNMIHCINIM